MSTVQSVVTVGLTASAFLTTFLSTCSFIHDIYIDKQREKDLRKLKTYTYGMRIRIGKDPTIYRIIYAAPCRETPGKKWYFGLMYKKNGRPLFDNFFDVPLKDIKRVTAARFWKTIRAATRLLALHHESVVRVNHPKAKAARGDFLYLDE